MDYQRAVFRVFSPEQRKAIWIAKLEEVMTMDWKDNEKEHIRSLQTRSQQEEKTLFSNESTEQQQDKLNIAAYRWAEYAKDVFGWDNKIIFAIVANPNNMQTKSGQMESVLVYAYQLNQIIV